MTLDSRALPRPRLDDVGIERSLHEKTRAVAVFGEVARDVLELSDEELANDLALGLGIGHAGEGAKESVLGLHVNEINPELAGEGLFNLVALVLSHKPGVDKDTGQLRPPGFGNERRGDGRVDAARECAEDLLREIGRAHV